MKEERGRGGREGEGGGCDFSFLYYLSLFHISLVPTMITIMLMISCVVLLVRGDVDVDGFPTTVNCTEAASQGAFTPYPFTLSLLYSYSFSLLPCSSPYSPLLTFPIITRLLCALPTRTPFSTNTPSSLPCFHLSSSPSLSPLLSSSLFFSL